ncbi:MAG: hypothetical protein HYX41_03125 [Bdellovibrio sp.]|nr:hypothetical protein [Bdellovibrio sp.]
MRAGLALLALLGILTASSAFAGARGLLESKIDLRTVVLDVKSAEIRALQKYQRKLLSWIGPFAIAEGIGPVFVDWCGLTGGVVRVTDARGVHLFFIPIGALEPLFPPGTPINIVMEVRALRESVKATERALIQTEALLENFAIEIEKLRKAVADEEGRFGTDFLMVDTPWKISEKQCREITFDRREKMGPDSDQGAKQTCWAHAAAALLEEQICESDPRNCGLQVSRSAVAEGSYRERNLYRLARPGTGFTEDALRHYSLPENRTVCLARYAPDTSGATEAQLFADLRALFKLFKTNGLLLDRSQYTMTFFRTLFRVKEFLEKNRHEWNLRTGDESKILSSTTFQATLSAAKDADEFIEKVMLYYCNVMDQPQINRRLPLVPTFRHYPLLRPNERLNVEAFLGEIRHATKEGHSLALDLCYFPLVSESSENVQNHFLNPNHCGRHVVVLNGAKWNPDTQSCQIHIKNSHGSHGKFRSGWYDAEVVFEQTFGIDYFELLLDSE